ncbi:EamA family transporter [Candidatus Woesearchaeota archaeon]|nr:EamA family transporter [Candidatus Woesearchaeota archaeon]
MATQLWAIGLVLVATLIGSFGPILLKKASEKKLSSIKSLSTNYPLFGGVSLYALGTLLFIPALKGGELSVLYPFVALAYVWVSLLSVRFLGEKMNRTKWIGIAMIIIGVTFIGLGSR